MEKVNVYNRNREITDKIKERNSLEKGEYRISVHIWIINSKSELLIQQRSETSKKFPSMWAQTGGGVLAGETSKEAVKREAKEELGINVEDEELYYISSYVRTRDIVDVWLVKKDIDIDDLELQKEEVAEAKFVSFEDFDNMIKDKKVVPTINPSYFLMKNYIDNYIDKN